MFIPKLKAKAFRPWAEASRRVYQDEYADQYLLHEGEFKSQPKDETLQRLAAAFPKQFNIDTPPDADPNDIYIHLFGAHPIDISVFLRLVKSLGWFVNIIEFEDGEHKGNDPKAIKRLTNHEYQETIIGLQPVRGIVEYPLPKFLYHVVPTPTWEQKIKQYGLSPRTEQLKSPHPERVYFLTTIKLAIQMAKDLATEKLKRSQTTKFDLTKFNPREFYKNWSVLQIDTSKIDHLSDGTTYFKLYRDQDTNITKQGYGLYSMNNVPPEAITVVKQFDVY
ncbi:MAG: hypothetical protein ACREAU_01215 [Nitrosopumilaceae archaeon]